MHAAQDKKHDIDRRRYPADLLEERLVAAHVDVRGAQQHAAQQGRYIQRGAACRDEKYKRTRQHQPVVRGAAVKQHAQQPSQQIGRQQHACIHRQRSDHALPVHHRGFRAGSDGRAHAESQQGHRVVHGYHLHQGVDERALGPVLPDGHQAGSGRGSGADGAQQQRKRQGQVKDHQHKGRDYGCGDQRLHQGEHNHLSTLLFEPVQPQIAAHAKGDKGQCDVGDEFHAAYDIGRNQVQRVGTDRHARKDIARNIGQLEHLGYARHQKTRQP